MFAVWIPDDILIVPKLKGSKMMTPAMKKIAGEMRRLRVKIGQDVVCLSDEDSDEISWECYDLSVLITKEAKPWSETMTIVEFQNKLKAGEYDLTFRGSKLKWYCGTHTIITPN